MLRVAGGSHIVNSVFQGCPCHASIHRCQINDDFCKEVMDQFITQLTWRTVVANKLHAIGGSAVASFFIFVFNFSPYQKLFFPKIQRHLAEAASTAVAEGATCWSCFRTFVAEAITKAATPLRKPYFYLSRKTIGKHTRKERSFRLLLRRLGDVPEARLEMTETGQEP